MLLAHQRRMLGGVRVTTPGSTSYTTPGTYSFVVPEYTTLTFDFKGAGGAGGGSVTISWGSAGGYTGFSDHSVYAAGGQPGTPGANGQAAHGNGFGGDTNTLGGGAPGGAPQAGYQYGGNGGRTVKTYQYGAPGAPIPGQTLTIVVGVGGEPGRFNGGSYYGNFGSNGSAAMSWT